MAVLSEASATATADLRGPSSRTHIKVSAWENDSNLQSRSRLPLSMIGCLCYICRRTTIDVADGIKKAAMRAASIQILLSM
jgi:hypothetical protein